MNISEDIISLVELKRILRDELSQFENKRKSTIFVSKLFKYAGILSILLSILITAVFIINIKKIDLNTMPIFYVFSPVILFWLFIFSLFIKPEKNLSKEIKSKISYKIEEIFNLEYLNTLEFGKNKELEEKAAIFNFTMQQDNIDDAFAGNYKGVNYLVCETKAHNTVYVLFKVFKNFKSETAVIAKKKSKSEKWGIGLLIFFILGCSLTFLLSIISPDKYNSGMDLWQLMLAVLPVLAGLLIFILMRKRRKISLESSKFQYSFETLGDELEGRYALSPAMIERLINLQNSFNGKKLTCKFINNIIQFEIETKKDLFEFTDLEYEVISTKFVSNFYNELVSIMSMIDYFKLDEKTGL